MASLHPRGGKFYVHFRLPDETQVARSTGTANKRDAEHVKRRIEDTLWQIQNAGLTIPDGVTTADFVFSGGTAKPLTESDKVQTLGQLVDVYRENIKPGKRQANTLKTERIHQDNLLRVLGGSVRLDKLNLGYLQKHYVNVRERDVQPYTINKELKALRQMWRWANKFNYVTDLFSCVLADFEFNRDDNIIEFATYDTISRRIARNPDLTAKEKRRLWKGLYLEAPEIIELIEFARATKSDHPFLVQIIAVAALAGLRRSEILRSEVEDWNFEDRTIVVREMKRVKGKVSTRSVEMHSLLAEIMQPYVTKSQSRYVFDGITPDVASQALKRALFKHQKFRHVRGYHVLRHSFISALAIAGVHSAIIRAFSGHLNEAISQHYTHIAPKIGTNRAIDKLLG